MKVLQGWGAALVSMRRKVPPENGFRQAGQRRPAGVGRWEHLFPWRHRELIWQLGRRDMLLRYRGSVFGLAWTILTPLALLGLYTLVFRHVFRLSWVQEGPDSNLDFALSLFAGMLIYQWASELWGRAPRLILEQPHLVTRVLFPLPALVWSALLAVSMQALVAAGVWLAACVLAGYAPYRAWLLLAIVPASLLPWLLGLGWLLCSLGVFFRDLGQLIGFALTGLLFLSPVFYPLEALPTWMRPIVEALPLAAPIEALRAIVLLHRAPDLGALAGVFASGIVVALVGLFAMHRLRHGFADLL